MRNSGRPHKLSTHVVKGYELVAFDIAAGVGGPERVIGWEVLGDMAAQNERPWRSPGVRSRLDELIDNNDAFDELIDTGRSFD